MSGETRPGSTPRVVGTAGHIDHGKTALVAALTGVDTDRLPEERRRGISIDLGFAPLDLGPGAPPASVVDVPGHEGFVRTMVAGATGIDAVLFVVAADEGMMPQSREHLLVLEALGVRGGVVAVTKADLVDPEWADLVVETIREELAGTALAGAPIVRVSSRTREGIDLLRAELARAVGGSPGHRDDFPFRLPVDRAFGIAGVGTVVTGTVWSGAVSVGGQVVGLPSGERARVRSIEVHGASVETAGAGRRAALALAGGGQGFARGTTLVAPERPWRAESRIEVRAWVAASAPRAVRSRDRVRLHHGTTEAIGRVRWYGGRGVEPGAAGFALLELETPVAAAVDDRFVLRAWSPMTTIGGGRILALGGRRLRGAARQARAERLGAFDRASEAERVRQALELAGDAGIEEAALPIATGLGERRLAAVAEDGSGIEVHGGRWFAASARAAAMERIEAALAGFHARESLRPGMPLEEARRAAGRAPAALVEASIETLVSSGAVERRGTTLARRGHRIELGASDRDVADRALARYARAGLEPPETPALAEELRVEASRLRSLLRHLEEEGRVVKLASDWYADPEALARAERLLVARLGAEGAGADTGAFKELFGVTRKYLIPILEYFDRSGLTRREGNRRVLAGRP